MRAIVVALGLVLFSTSARAQDVIWYMDGEAPDDRFGYPVEVLPDFDGDGVPELLIGAYAHTCDGLWEGKAYVVSTTQGILGERCGDQDSEAFPASAAVLGDVDSDGVADYALGSPYFEPPGSSYEGRVFVMSGPTMNELLEVGNTMGYSGYFGSRLAGLDDLDGDGYPELLVTYFHEDLVHVMSTKDGAILRTHTQSSEYYYGANLAALGDLDGDGVKDYAVSSWMDYYQEQGRVHVYSGATGVELWYVTGLGNYDRLGVSIADGGDIDGDGVPDMICGGMGGVTGGGHFDGYSSTGKLLFRIDALHQTEEFGVSCAMVGDVNDDGINDYLVGAPGNSSHGLYGGRATAYSGRTLLPLCSFYGEYESNVFGWQVRGGVDFNHDGIGDFVVSSMGGAENTPAGRVYIFAGNDLYLQASDVDPVPGDTVNVSVRGGPSKALAEILLIDVSGVPTCDILAFGLLNGNGNMFLSADVPPEAAGLEFTIIAFAQESDHKPKWVDSSPLTIRIQ